ncbi:MAG TPA: Do family serine endopeptidase [Verrucomicrobiae bacterium]|nr:Do family serine endopeptidase [Verrucomicrobiae bacterium]
MKLIAKPLYGFLSVMVGALLAAAAFHLNLLAKDVAPDIKVESTPINRDMKGVTSFAPVVKKAAPSVVNIYSTHIVHVRRFQNPIFNDPMFRRYFGIPDEGQNLTRKEQSLGSGVIISPDGYILTANHVVEGADEIKVAIANDKTEYVAKIIGTDPTTDVAVLKIDAKNLPAITLGDSSQLEVGDIVLAIGNPFGIAREAGQPTSVTMGIVSALGRNGYDFSQNGRVQQVQDFIQTDAPINPGNSGGALVDAEGRLIGINTAIISSSDSSAGIGFAVPINMARDVMNKLISSGGKILHGYLGISMQDITPDFVKAFGLPDQNGALVGGFLPNSVAQKAGIKTGDVIIAFDGKPVTDAHSLQLLVSGGTPGSSVLIKVIRKGKPETLTVKLGRLPGELAQNDDEQNDSNSSNPDALDGVTFGDLSQEARYQLKIPDDIKGAIVTDVGQDSNAADAGLRVNDVIIQINQQPAEDADTAVKLCNDAKGDRILLQVWRRTGDLATTTFLSVDNTERQK